MRTVISLICLRSSGSKALNHLLYVVHSWYIQMKTIHPLNFDQVQFEHHDCSYLDSVKIVVLHPTIETNRYIILIHCAGDSMVLRFLV